MALPVALHYLRFHSVLFQIIKVGPLNLLIDERLQNEDTFANSERLLQPSKNFDQKTLSIVGQSVVLSDKFVPGCYHLGPCLEGILFLAELALIPFVFPNLLFISQHFHTKSQFTSLNKLGYPFPLEVSFEIESALKLPGFSLLGLILVKTEESFGCQGLFIICTSFEDHDEEVGAQIHVSSPLGEDKPLAESGYDLLRLNLIVVDNFLPLVEEELLFLELLYLTIFLQHALMPRPLRSEPR